MKIFLKLILNYREIRNLRKKNTDTPTLTKSNNDFPHQNIYTSLLGLYRNFIKTQLFPYKTKQNLMNEKSQRSKQNSFHIKIESEIFQTDLKRRK
ncbi:hypothetical protein DLM75_20515 [Leptospira stimsonii]|uniref:Uncharacterized protein n=1 Tax=Leptospira stimsonii TaxID=2202203 RepID=A0A396YVX3_9LEPT|nr:hypothetical protein DLM75_20515 [Leptospira stimsonii]